MGFSTQKIYGSIIYSSDNKLLVVQGRKTGKWSFPKGHKNEEETAYDCSLRETYEETGLLLKGNYLEELQLAAGKYFVYKLEDKPDLISYDDSEIMNLCWVDLNDLRFYHYNCDIRSYIMNAHDIRHNKMYLNGYYNLDLTYLILKRERMLEKRKEYAKKTVEYDGKMCDFEKRRFTYVEYY